MPEIRDGDHPPYFRGEQEQGTRSRRDVMELQWPRQPCIIRSDAAERFKGNPEIGMGNSVYVVEGSIGGNDLRLRVGQVTMEWARMVQRRDVHPPIYSPSSPLLGTSFRPAADGDGAEPWRRRGGWPRRVAEPDGGQGRPAGRRGGAGARRHARSRQAVLLQLLREEVLQLTGAGRPSERPQEREGRGPEAPPVAESGGRSAHQAAERAAPAGPALLAASQAAEEWSRHGGEIPAFFSRVCDELGTLLSSDGDGARLAGQLPRWSPAFRESQTRPQSPTLMYPWPFLSYSASLPAPILSIPPLKQLLIL